MSASVGDPAPGSKSPTDVTVVIMAYNEAASVGSVVREILNAVVSLRVRYEILIVDDGSTDETGQIADTLAAEIRDVRVIHHSPNLGLGGVYRTGFTRSRGELVTFFPADGQFPATIIPRFYALAQNADLVLGYLRGQRRSLVAHVLSFGERLLYRVLLGPMPRFQGVMMVRRRVLNEVTLASTGRGWAVLMELVIRASRGGYRLVSEPTSLRPRMSGASKVNNWPTIRANFRQMLELRRHL